jgi:phosphopantetheine--protein transferase-like protein
MIKGVGVDIAQISRFKKIIESKHCENFLRKVLHLKEIEEYRLLNEDKKAIFLASRWSYKEALVKALGDKGLIFSSVRLVKDETGKDSLFKESPLSRLKEGRI